jgi:hypothetical protein
MKQSMNSTSVSHEFFLGGVSYFSDKTESRHANEASASIVGIRPKRHNASSDRETGTGMKRPA